MAMNGLKDRVAVVGVGSTRFTDHWDLDAEDLVSVAVDEACSDAGLTRSDIEAVWAGVFFPFTGIGGAAVADPLAMYGRPVTRVDNFCASGADAFRSACLAVAAGACDIALACGVEKITDQGARGLPNLREGGHPFLPAASAPALFAMVATRCLSVHGWTKEDMAAVAVKNHRNGAAHPKAHFRKEVSEDDVLGAPMIASPLGRLDCSGVSDGAAAVIVARPEIARGLLHKDDFPLVKAAVICSDSNEPMYLSRFDYLGFPATQQAARIAYEQAGISDPVAQIDVAEVHDCFTITELVIYEDLGLCERGGGAGFIRDGHSQPDGAVPVNPSGGLKSFGHPVGATGCRMIAEITRQLQGRAEGVQIADAELGLAHNLGGPGAVASVSILGR